MASDGSVILYSGHRDTHLHETALIVSEEKANTLLEWEPINDRMIKARFNSNSIVSLPSFSVTYHEVESKETEDWYEQLQQEVYKVPHHDLVLIIGNMDVKVGADDSNSERDRGKHGCGVINNNRERLVDFCLNNNCIVGGTIFPHKDIYKPIWRSPDGIPCNQIYRIIINGKGRGSMHAVRVSSGADNNSDHHYVLAYIQLKVHRAVQQNERRKKLDITRLKYPDTNK